MKRAKKYFASFLILALLLSIVPMSAMATLYAGGEDNHTTAYLDLTGFLRSELSSIPAEYVLANLKDYSGNPITVEGSIAAYAMRNTYRKLSDGSTYYIQGDDEFVPVGSDGTLDLNPNANYYSSGTVRLLIGNLDQLDRSNKFIDVQMTYSSETLTAFAWMEDGTPMSVMRLYESTITFSSTGERRNYLGINVMPQNGWTSADPVRIKLQLNDSFANSGVTVKAYLGEYSSLEEIPAGAEEITEALFNGETGYLKETRYSMDLTLVWTRNGQSTVVPYYVSISAASTDMYLRQVRYRESEASSWTSFSYSSSSSYRNGVRTYTIKVDESYPLDGSYMLSLYYLGYDSSMDNSLVSKAVVGAYDSLESAANAEDVKSALFADSWNADGYVWNFAEGPLTVTVFDTYGNVLQESYTLARRETAPVSDETTVNPFSSDVYFGVNSAYSVYSVDNDVYTIACDTFVMPYDDDSYYHSGYQTVFMLQEDTQGPVQGNLVVPYFYTGYGVHAYAEVNGETVLQQSGTNQLPFTPGEAIHYSTAAEDGSNNRNYYVTFVNPTPDSKIFVNAATNSQHLDAETGLPTRVVYLDENHDYHHDVLFANLGMTTMTGLSVTLTDAVGIKLDDYWTIRSDSVGVLPPYNLNTKDNFGKIRLLPTDETAFTAVKGTLTISADNNEPVVIKLTGVVGTPRITTEVLASGAVRFVPYASMIQTNYIGDVTDAISFSVVSGELPAGVTLRPNGEVYGVPMETGTFTFTVQINYKGDTSVKDTKTYTIVVANNTDENVEAATDEAYKLIDRLPASIIASEQTVRSEGAFVEFMELYLDGVKLTRGVDYTAESGSTKITISDETLEGTADGEHTLAAEFRVGGSETGELKRFAQNFTLTHQRTHFDPWADYPLNPTETEPAPEETTTEEEEKTTEEEKEPVPMAFKDVKKDDWFYNDVEWAFQKGLLIGVSETEYDPKGVVDAATIVTVLARTIGVDLDQYADGKDGAVPQDEWFSAAANWATQAGLIDSTFERNKPLSRGQMAVLLYKYLAYVGIDCSQPDPLAEFTDADKMTPAEHDAFQVLFAYDIFRGVGNNTMDVQSSTNRSQLSALMHRVYDFIESKIG